MAQELLISCDKYTFMKKSNWTHSNALTENVIFLLGILVFAFFIGQKHGLVVVALAGLILSVIVISIRIRNVKDLPVVFGFGKFYIPSLFFLPFAIIAGVLFGVIYRDSLDIGLIPSRLTGFAILASMIGATEELLFRGYFQTQIRKYGAFLSVLFASMAHTAYKFLFFLPIDAGLRIDLSGLLLWTFVGGLIFGLLKENSKSTIYPILGHVAFDIIVYGDRIISPWWIWT
jgi:membrane protease YdiL (CAAX protease family)